MSPRRSSRQPSVLYLLLLLLVAGGIYLYQNGYLSGLGVGPASPVTSVDATNWGKAYFTTPGSGVEQGGLDETLAADIDAAQKTVDVASFDFDLESLTQALIRAQDRGVQVRMVLDDENLSSEEMTRVTKELKNAGIPIVYDERGAFMHNKFVVIDGRVVWMGSWNLTINDTYYNNNNALRLELPVLAENYTNEFNKMFEDKLFGPQKAADNPHPVLEISDGSRIESYFAPEDSVRGAIIAQIQAAKTEVDFMAFSFTDDEIGRALIEAAQRGVKVRGVFESRGADTEYSEYNLLKKAGLDVVLDGNPRVMHHKVFVIDGQVTITGSYNFTANAAEDNDENLLIIENAGLAQSYQQEFERVYQAGQ